MKSITSRAVLRVHAMLAAVLALGGSGLSAVAADVTFTSLLQEMVNRDAVARWPSPAYTCAQASSYDRATTTADKPEWFANKDFDQCIRSETIDGRQEFVIMDVAGPGAITRFWKGGNDPQNRVRIYLDGAATPAIDEIADAWLGGALWVKNPFAAVRARGINLYLPIPYAKHCKVTLDRLKADWYNIEYRTYPAETTVTTFTRSDYDANAARLEQTGRQLIGCGEGLPTNLRQLAPQSGTLAPGQALTTTVKGPAAIRLLSARVKGSNQAQALRSTVLAIACDGEPTVWCPLGDFFGSGVGLNPYHDWYRAVDSNGLLRCWWVMPFKASCTVTLTNLGKKPVEATLGAIGVGDWAWDERSMLFHGAWRQEYPLQTRKATGTADWNFVSITGRGVYLGDTLAIHNGSAGWWGEGDEKIFVDGETFPSHFGTGSEDYYGYAWGHPSFFEAPFHAQPQWRGNNHVGHTTDSRTRSLDAIPFTRGLVFDMEVWHWEATEMAYAAATYWYARPGATCNRQPEPAEAARPVPPGGSLDRAEGEAMPIAACTGGKTETQNDGRWSRGCHLWWRDAKPGDQLDLTFDTEADGRYKLGAILTTARDYGIVQLALDGDKLGEPVDGYTPTVELRTLDLGLRALKAGPHVLSVTIAGANPAAEPRHMFGLDCLTVIPVP